MGQPKATLAFGGGTLLERALDAAAKYPTVVVVSVLPGAALAALERRQRESGVMRVTNDAPERGMAHSLALAHAAIGMPNAALAVLLIDTPFVDAVVLARVVAARGDADVAYPVRDGRAGHPVVFGPHARAAIEALPDGDTLRTLRDDPRWRRVEVEWDDDAPFRDIDTPDDYAQALEGN